jgi:hypothetical protein
VRDHEELLDRLRLAVLVERDALGGQARDEVAVLVEGDRVDFDEFGGRSEGRLPRGRSLAGARQGDPTECRENQSCQCRLPRRSYVSGEAGGGLFRLLRISSPRLSR